MQKFLETVVGPRFTENKVEISISVGDMYPPIPLCVNEFVPLDEAFLLIQNFGDGKLNQRHKLAGAYTPPFGLTESACSGLEEKWLEYAKATISGQRNPGELKYGETSTICWLVHELIVQYWKSTKVCAVTICTGF